MLAPTMQTNDLFNSYFNLNMCRICLEQNNKLVPIFDPVKPPHFSILIMACANVQVYEHDGLPSYICQKCIARLNIAFQFKTECEKTDAKIRKWLTDYNARSLTQNNSDCPILTSNTNQYSNSGNDNAENQMQLQHTCIEPATGVIKDERTVKEPSSKHRNITNLSGKEIAPHHIQQEIHPDNKNSLNEMTIERIPSTNLNHNKNAKLNKHPCLTCGKVFKTKPSLNHHTRIHTGERPYVCHLCQKRFVNGGHLHTHMRTHTGEKNHICVSCTKAFATVQQLTKHTIAIHTSERPYVCSYCMKRFASSSNLNTHTKIHTGEKNFHCDLCGKTFSTKGQLQQHSLVHSGEKAFLCEYCDKRFAQKAHLVRHQKIHANIKL